MTFVTNSELSLTEGVGSQCLEYSCLLIVARNTGKQCVVTRSYLGGKTGIKMFECFDHPLPIVDNIPVAIRAPMDLALNGLDPFSSYDFKMVHKPMTAFIKTPGDVDLIRGTFRFRDEMAEAAASTVQSIGEATGLPVASVHFRDYLGVPPHLILSEKYYRAAIDKLHASVGRCALLLFSNNIPRLKKMKLGKAHDMPEFYPDQMDYFEMAMMCASRHLVMGNSTFSLMAAMLMKKPETVICPWHWVDPKFDNRQKHPVNGRWFLPQWSALKET